MKNTLKAIIIASSFAPLSAYATQTYNLKMATSWTPVTVQLNNSVQKFVDNVEKMSGGRIHIQIDNATKTKAPLGVLDLVKSGQYDIGHTASYFYKGKDINMLGFTTMPFGMTALEQYSWYYYDKGLDFLQQAFKTHRIVAFLGGNTGMQMGGWFNKEINSVEDLKGLRIRIPGFGGEVFSRSGALVTNIPVGETYTAMERGTIDAVEWSGPAMDYDLGYPKVAKFYYTGWQEPATETLYLVNDRVYNKLPEDLQDILKTAMKSAAYDMWINSQLDNAIYLAKIKHDYPEVQIKTFPKNVFTAFRASYGEIIKDIKAQSPFLSQVIDSQESYLKLIRPWTITADYGYLTNSPDGVYTDK